MEDKSFAVLGDLRQTPQGRLAMWILIAGELVIFGGLIACYLLYRVRFGDEFGEQASHTSTFWGSVNTFILLTSSLFAVKAHAAVTTGDRKKTVQWMALTVFCGLGFLGVKTIEYYTELTHGFTMSSPHLVETGQAIGATFWSFYYLMTGLHGLHVVVGMIVILAVMKGVTQNKNLHRVELAGMYWHMVDLVWIFLFPLIYIAK